MQDKITFQLKNGVLVKHVDQYYDSITTFFTIREKFEYVGDGNLEGTKIKFLVDVPTRKAEEVFWVHHTRKLCECSKLLVVLNDQERIDELAENAGCIPKRVRLYINNLKSLKSFEIIDRGTCPETGRDNVILSCKVGQEVFTRIVIWVDMAQGDYYIAFEGETANKEIMDLHDPEL